LQFDLISAWEVMEHLPEERLPVVCENFKRHLMPNGIVVVSISSTEEIVRGVKLHLTVKKKKWWKEMFAFHSLYHMENLENYFNTQYVRGHKQNAPGSFHLVLSPDPSKSPLPPKVNLKEWLLDRWIFSRGQKILKKLLLGV
jgi:cyclopropane fatty-acyl-phospholipid synthase-like methyltransferase